MRYIFLSLIFMITLGLNAQTPKTTAKDKKCPNKEQSCKKECVNKDKSKSQTVNKSVAPCCAGKQNSKQECKKVEAAPQTGATDSKCPGQKKDCRSTCPNKKAATK